MLQPITKELIDKTVPGAVVSGVALLRRTNIRPTTNGNAYAMGFFEASSGIFPFKAWEQSEAFPSFQQADELLGKVCQIDGKVDLYADVKSLVVTTIKLADEEQYRPEMFMLTRYNIEDLKVKFRSLITKDCSPEAVECLDAIIAPVYDRFLNEYCALGFHDAFRHGLYAHSRKVTHLAQVIKMYPHILKAIDLDTLYVGCAIHDIGKILEYENGTISAVGKYASHTSLGLELLTPHKDLLVKKKGASFYNDLLSIISQHHGEFGERPRTVIAYVVHLLDALEATLESLDESIESSKTNEVKVEEFPHLRFRNEASNEE